MRCPKGLRSMGSNDNRAAFLQVNAPLTEKTWDEVELFWM